MSKNGRTVKCKRLIYFKIFCKSDPTKRRAYPERSDFGSRLVLPERSVRHVARRPAERGAQNVLFQNVARHSAELVT